MKLDVACAAFDLLHLFVLSVFADGHQNFPDVEPAPTHVQCAFRPQPSIFQQLLEERFRNVTTAIVVLRSTSLA
jgi:hypothetical protein